MTDSPTTSSVGTDKAEVCPNICQDCERRYHEMWYAPKWLWDLLTDRTIGMLCIPCFIARGEAAGVERDAWLVSPYITERDHV